MAEMAYIDVEYLQDEIPENTTIEVPETVVFKIEEIEPEPVFKHEDELIIDSCDESPIPFSLLNGEVPADCQLITETESDANLEQNVSRGM